MTLFTAWLRAVGRWFAELKHLWLALAVTLVALAISVRPGTTEPLVRLSGLVLQLLGIATVAWGIGETRTLFGHPPIFTIARSWIGRFPRFRRQTATATVNFTLPAATLCARAYSMDGVGLDPSLEARVHVLEKNLLSTNQRIDQNLGEMDSSLRTAKAALEQEAQIRLTEDQSVQAKLEATATGGVHISAIGALWLFVGVTLSSASPEIAKWFQ